MATATWRPGLGLTALPFLLWLLTHSLHQLTLNCSHTNSSHSLHQSIHSPSLWPSSNHSHHGLHPKSSPNPSLPQFLQAWPYSPVQKAMPCL